MTAHVLLVIYSRGDSMRHGWSLQAHTWQYLMELFEEYQVKAWKKYPLDIQYKAMIPKSKSGIYMLCLPPMECEEWFFGRSGRLNIFNTIYVGRSEDLQRRFSNYVRRRGISRTIQDFLEREKHREITFGYAVCDVSAIKKIEGALIKCFGPSANMRDEDGPSREATLGKGRDI